MCVRPDWSGKRPLSHRTDGLRRIAARHPATGRSQATALPAPPRSLQLNSHDPTNMKCHQKAPRREGVQELTNGETFGRWWCSSHGASVCRDFNDASVTGYRRSVSLREATGLSGRNDDPEGRSALRSLPTARRDLHCAFGIGLAGHWEDNMMREAADPDRKPTTRVPNSRHQRFGVSVASPRLGPGHMHLGPASKRANGACRISLCAALVISTALGCSLPSAAWNSCRFSEDRDVSLPVGDATGVEIIARAGKLDVTGRSGLDQVRVHGRACASSQKALDQIELETRRTGSEIVIEAKIPAGRLFSNATLDLEVELPETLALAITDSSGGVAIRNAGSVRLDDGSGGIVIERIAGEVYVEDGSGSVRIADVRGDVDLKDGSGSLSVTGIGGGVTIRDGSGDIEVEGVEGDVTVTEDGSGGISARRVGGDFVVEEDGSGHVRLDEIRGRVSVRD